VRTIVCNAKRDAFKASQSQQSTAGGGAARAPLGLLSRPRASGMQVIPINIQARSLAPQQDSKTSKCGVTDPDLVKNGCVTLTHLDAAGWDGR
jgi:hypothetical protein